MRDNKVKRRLFIAILVMTGVPLAASFYFLDAALRRSLDLGFNPQVVRALDIGAANLKSLKDVDPANEEEYRRRFDEISMLRHVYAQPDVLKRTVYDSLRLYFAIGVIGAVLLALCVAGLLGTQINRSYQATFDELMAQRDRVTYLEQMAKWQELARILAHEIKNPLTPIEVLVTSLSKAYASKSAAEFERQLTQAQAIIGEELNHLKKTVSRFSEFARLPEAQLTEANPAQLVESHVPALAASFGSADISVDASGCPAGARAKMDSLLFRQVLMNIVSNGVEANPGKRVAFLIRIGCTADTVLIEVSNDGVPVPPSLAARIFDPYVSGSGGKDNMGLGLAIVKKVVIEHGGEISYSERNGHPCFTLALARVA